MLLFPPSVGVWLTLRLARPAGTAPARGVVAQVRVLAHDFAGWKAS